MGGRDAEIVGMQLANLSFRPLRRLMTRYWLVRGAPTTRSLSAMSLRCPQYSVSVRSPWQRMWSCWRS